MLKILVLGSNGLIGNTLIRVLMKSNKLLVRGTIRNSYLKASFPSEVSNMLISDVELTNIDKLIYILSTERPDVVINAAGLTKHLPDTNSPLLALPINSMLPHRLVEICNIISARLIHISSDCVFKGDRGLYTENDCPDAQDLYGQSKALGEINLQGHITIRTSTIGHELNTEYGLLNWFLKQRSTCKGYSKAVFSGLPTVYLAEVIRDFVIPDKGLFGIFNIAAPVINKYDLLCLIADIYGKSIDIISDESIEINRSLCGKKFDDATGHKSPEWSELIQRMYESRGNL